MKIRTGFVSNSSSSSFAILGTTVSKELKEKAKELSKDQIGEPTEEYWCCSKCGTEPPYGKKPKFCDKCGSAMHNATRAVEPDIYELFEEVLGLDYYPDSDYGNVVGFNIDGKTIEEVQELHKKLVEKLGENNYKILTGEYAC